MSLSTHNSRRPSPLRPNSFNPENPTFAADGFSHPILHEGRVAVITGASSGIGRAAANELAKIGMKLVLADVDAEGLEDVSREVSNIIGKPNVLAIPTDVSQLHQVVQLRDKVYEAWGEVSVLMNNAGVGAKGTSWGGVEGWHEVFDVNLFGVLNIQQTFVPSLIHQENPALIINTGSKQGITNPPGNAAYNAAKAAVKSLTESLAHELRNTPNCDVTAHLFIPGWTWTGMTGNKGDGDIAEKPAGAWTAEETVTYMLDHVRAGEFYILCPDNETRREVDQLRIMWGAADIVEGRPALSRWHKDYKSIYEEYIRENIQQLD